MHRCCLMLEIAREELDRLLLNPVKDRESCFDLPKLCKGRRDESLNVAYEVMIITQWQRATPTVGSDFYSLSSHSIISSRLQDLAFLL